MSISLPGGTDRVHDDDAVPERRSIGNHLGVTPNEAGQSVRSPNAEC